VTKPKPTTALRIGTSELQHFLKSQLSHYFEHALSISGERYLNIIGQAMSTSIFRRALEYWPDQPMKLSDDFALQRNPVNSRNIETSFASRVPSRAIEESACAQDQFDATDRLTLSYGARLDLFQARYDLQAKPRIVRDYSFLSPRLGFAYRLGKTGAVLFGKFAYVFLPPPIEFFELSMNETSGGYLPP